MAETLRAAALSHEPEETSRQKLPALISNTHLSCKQLPAEHQAKGDEHQHQMRTVASAVHHRSSDHLSIIPRPSSMNEA